MKHVTIKDVAKKLNVSISSVSRALNNKPDIKKETRELILKTAEDMGYTPNPIAKHLSERKSYIIGAVVPELMSEYFSQVVIALQDFLSSNGYQLIVMHSDENPELELKNVKTLIRNMVDGLIIAPVVGNMNKSFYLEKQKQDFPIVFMSRVSSSYPASKVIFNNTKWSFFATEHLIRQNYKKIYHLSGYKGMSVTKERVYGFEKALKKHKIPKERYKIIETGLNAEEGMEAIEDLIFNHDLPDAFFCVNDMVALGAIKKLKENGYKVPEDVAFIGFTETLMAELVTPQLSSVKQPTYKMAETAGKLLLEIINDNTTEVKTVVLNGELNIRNSSINPKSNIL
ncbi:LacI family DNA-binding transcriptional regulator [Flavivirga abyssicola]|uniref:LacI family DNA-binding transcriptional regulator n=1 Tax=Flavivirga abyssicola TaxID=3063533 RepID=UPI0026E034E1|nr:LacI family DNA-binding transcriptional regulator [Flavivirga sp. MEBiC07777]WVK13786.1 LacI family DNA-binding transcriptional regulator [Flavivirga sp. MEBiC07777]